MASLQAFFSFLPRAPKFPLPLPLLTPATQATVNEGQTEVVICDLTTASLRSDELYIFLTFC